MMFGFVRKGDFKVFKDATLESLDAANERINNIGSIGPIVRPILENIAREAKDHIEACAKGVSAKIEQAYRDGCRDGYALGYVDGKHGEES